jgi:hypothetical protein
MVEAIHRTKLGEREYQSDGVLELKVVNEMFALLQKLAEKWAELKLTRMTGRQKFTTRRLLQRCTDGQRYTTSSCDPSIQCRS